MIGANFNPDLCRHVMSQLLWVNGSTGKSALCTPFIFLNWQLYIQVPRDLATHRWTVLIIARGYPKFQQTIWLTCVKSCSELLTIWKTFKKLNPVYSVVDIVHVGGLEEYAGESVSVWQVWDLVWLMGQLWLFCVNEITTTIVLIWNQQQNVFLMSV